MGELGTLSPAWRWTTNAISLLSVFFFSGIIFGWAPLELMLLEEGQYEELCYQDGANESFSSSTCADRMNRLNAIFTLAQFFLSFASLPIGFLLDIAPKPFHFAIAGILEMTGLVLFSISDSDSDRDYFLLGYSLLAVGGCMTMLGAFPASFLLAKYQAGILVSLARGLSARRRISITGCTFKSVLGTGGLVGRGWQGEKIVLWGSNFVRLSFLPFNNLLLSQQGEHRVSF